MKDSKLEKMVQTGTIKDYKYASHGDYGCAAYEYLTITFNDGTEITVMLWQRGFRSLYLLIATVPI